ncbi:type II secretion system F family protein [Caulobacter sp. KR2-114]|uniref:type II secretion system F family protein n=1 Tax=Caulobacter sp. KR2-114 TaxID=3400912 RepID=UPI003C07E1A6
MAEERQANFAYWAVDPAGRRVRGQVQAADDTAAYGLLKRDGLSPTRLQRVAPRSRQTSSAPGNLTDRQVGAFLSSLAVLLNAGADMRSALSLLARSHGAVSAFAQGLAADISGGGAIDASFEARLPKRMEFVGALIAAGEASGDLAGGLQRAADMLAARLKIRDQLVAALSYPAFVLASTIAALAVILLFVIPSLAPLVNDSGQKPPLTLALLIGASTGLKVSLPWIGVGLAAGTVGLWLAARGGLLTRPFEAFLLQGPFARTARAIVYGGYAVALGSILASGASMSEALRLSNRIVRQRIAREQVELAAAAVREGQALSLALEGVAGLPDAIQQLAAVGEASGSLGTMLLRAGALQEQEAIQRIEAAGRVLGPALIVLLGGVVGLLMAGLLTGVAQLGQLSVGST